MQNNELIAADPFGQAILDYANGRYLGDITTYISLGEEDVLSLPYLFRDFEAMPVLEQEALKACRGTVLDVGCGAGSHSLYLQDSGFDVTALDASEEIVAAARIRGVKKTVHSRIMDYHGMKFDTLLLMMHGIGMAEKLSGLVDFLQHLKALLNPDGQVLLDSSDIIYMFDRDADGGYWIPGDKAYYGEVEFITEYQGRKSVAFPWLYLDYPRLEEAAKKCGLECELVRSGDHYDYLARLIRK